MRRMRSQVLVVAVLAFLGFAGPGAVFDSSLAHDGTGLGDMHQDAVTAERAVAGAEWLAAKAQAGEEALPGGAGSAELAGWLLDHGAPAAEQGGGEFGAALAALGYGDEAWAESLWAEEFLMLLEAYSVGRGGSGTRSLAEIDAEIATLPSVPLDEAGAAERDRLMAERARAAIPAAFVAAVTGLAARIEAVRAIAASGGRP